MSPLWVSIARFIFCPRSRFFRRTSLRSAESCPLAQVEKCSCTRLRKTQFPSRSPSRSVRQTWGPSARTIGWKRERSAKSTPPLLSGAATTQCHKGRKTLPSFEKNFSLSMISGVNPGLSLTPYSGEFCCGMKSQIDFTKLFECP